MSFPWCVFDWILLGGPPLPPQYFTAQSTASLWSPQRLGSVTFIDVSVSLAHTWISRKQIWKGIQPSNSAHTINCERHLYDYYLFTKYSSLVLVAFFGRHLPICFHVPDSERNEVMATVSTLDAWTQTSGPLFQLHQADTTARSRSFQPGGNVGDRKCTCAVRQRERGCCL